MESDITSAGKILQTIKCDKQKYEIKQQHMSSCQLENKIYVINKN